MYVQKNSLSNVLWSEQEFFSEDSDNVIMSRYWVRKLTAFLSTVYPKKIVVILSGYIKILLTRESFRVTITQQWRDFLKLLNKFSEMGLDYSPEVQKKRALNRALKLKNFFNRFHPQKSTDLSIVDIGGGNGKILDTFQNLVKNKGPMYVIETSEQVERMKYYGRSYGEKIKFMSGNEETLALYKFDIVVFLQSLHHIKNVDLLIRNLHESLNDGALVIILEHDVEPVKYTFGMSHFLDLVHCVYMSTNGEGDYRMLDHGQMPEQVLNARYFSRKRLLRLFNDDYELVHTTKSKTIFESYYLVMRFWTNRDSKL